MPDQSPIDPNHEGARTALSGLGGVLLLVGAIMTLIGLGDFFSSFSNPGRGFPSMFWCAIIGLPMLGIGAKLLFFGNMGRIARYMSQEVTPVGTDTFNYAVGQTKDSMRDVAQAVGEGLGLHGNVTTSAKCSNCGHANDADAHYCSGCGQPLKLEKPCPQCGHKNDNAARFCDQCGNGL